jgi:hypothetical protein
MTSFNSASSAITGPARLRAAGGSAPAADLYRVGPVAGDRWTIVDEDGGIMFAGTKRQCEDWLDWRENSRARTGILSAFWRMLFRRIASTAFAGSLRIPADRCNVSTSAASNCDESWGEGYHDLEPS